MHINFKKIVFVFILFFFSFSIAHANTIIHLTIATPANTFYDADISVDPCDSDGAGTMRETPYCAIKQTGLSNSWSWYGTGAFLDSINGIAGYTSYENTSNPVYHYWSWSLNGAYGTTGLNEYDLVAGDVVSLTFIDPQNPSLQIIMSGGSNIETEPIKQKKDFDLKKALDFLATKQKQDGSFGENLYTDWAAIAFASSDGYSNEKNTLKEYLFSMKTEEWSLTDYERHAMALMSLGMNPYNTNGINYIEKIANSFDGKQFGNPFEDNDDIFALIVFQNTEYDKENTIIKNAINFLLSKQKQDGSWDESVDLTGAAMEALTPYKDITLVKNALDNASKYLSKNLRKNGSFVNNISSTAWALEGLLADNKDYDKTDQVNYFANNQSADGGIKEADTNSKMWETAYVASILSNKTWNEIMQKFKKPLEITANISTQAKPETLKKITKKETNLPTAIQIDQPAPQKSWWKSLWRIFGI